LTGSFIHRIRCMYYINHKQHLRQLLLSDVPKLVDNSVLRDYEIEVCNCRTQPADAMNMQARHASFLQIWLHLVVNQLFRGGLPAYSGGWTESIAITAAVEWISRTKTTYRYWSFQKQITMTFTRNVFYVVIAQNWWEYVLTHTRDGLSGRHTEKY
jgi:hypothetical protein